MRGQNTHNFRQPRQRSLTLRHAADEGVSSKELTLDFEKRIVTVRGKLVHLTPKEFDLLRELVANQGTPVAHRQLLKAAWGPDYGGEIESLRVVVNQLRKKIESDPARPKYIRTEPCIGYRFVLPAGARVIGPQ
jgi:two-component system, OmpR family, KDP operon response regulator KdpE